MKLEIEDLEYLALGAAVLSSGGGGVPLYDQLMSQSMMERYGSVKLLQLEDISDEDFVVPIAFMGAPLVWSEKISNGKEFIAIFKELEKSLCKKPTAILSAEIGGANAFTAIWVGAMLNLPVLNADLVGRAFPELQMTSCTVKGLPAAPVFLADGLGNVSMINSKDPFTIERLARQLTIGMGSKAAFAFHLMNGKEAKLTTIKGSITRAISIGKAIINARLEKLNPTEEVIKVIEGRKIGSGTLIDIDQKIEGGFLKGSAKLVTASGREISVMYQNEYLIASHKEEVLATTPDIIMFLEESTGTPITSSSLKYGLRVDLIAFEPAALWKTTEGLSLVGPKYFGYNVEYHSIKNNKTGGL